jgi:hypothetical protein
MYKYIIGIILVILMIQLSTNRILILCNELIFKYYHILALYHRLKQFLADPEHFACFLILTP